MPALDDLRRKLTTMFSQQPAMEPNAYSRIGHNPMMILPEDQFAAASSRAGYATPPQAMTLQQGDSSSIADYFRSPAVRGMLQSMKSSPTMVFNRSTMEGAMPHEIAHTLTGGANAPDPQQVLKLLSPQAIASLQRQNYNTPAQQAAELPARLMDPSQAYGLGLNKPEDVESVYNKYTKMLSPQAAAQFQALWRSKHPQKDAAQRNTDVNQQPPSHSF